MPAWSLARFGPSHRGRHYGSGSSSPPYNVGRAVGPALGGLLIAAAGPPWVFTINAVSFLGVIVVVFAWKSSPTVSRLPMESLAGATRACLRYGANAPVLRGVLARTALFILPAAALQALLPTVVRERLHLSSGGYGVLLGCFGIGAALSAVVRPRLTARFSPDRLVVISSLVTASSLAVVGGIAVTALACIALFFGGFAWTIATTTANVAAQSALAPWVRARGLGLYLLVITGSVAIGSALWGFVSEWSLVGAHFVATGATIVGLAGSWRWRLSEVFEFDLTPVPGADPIVTLVPGPTDGPVVVTVAYVVPDPDIVDFAASMKVVEGHRRRTGAYQWGLFRDLEAPNRFLEIFHVESWVEHLRQHQRSTARFDAMYEHPGSYLDTRQPVHHLLSAFSPGGLEPLAPHDEQAPAPMGDRSAR